MKSQCSDSLPAAFPTLRSFAAGAPLLVLLLGAVACDGGGACSDTLPAAGYAKSCEDCQMDGSVLSCNCGDGHNGMVATTLDTCTCESAETISNCGGNLQCTDCACIPNGNACGPSNSDVEACCSGHCGDHGTCD